MAGNYLTCPFCGMEFLKQDTLCEHGCPLGGACKLVRCPNCLYEYPEAPAPLTLWKRLFGSRRVDAMGHPARVLTVDELERGEHATVLRIRGDRGHRRSNLVVFGIAPGADVQVVQRRPSCVVRVGETELALDPEIARTILVQRDPTSPPPVTLVRR